MNYTYQSSETQQPYSQSSSDYLVIPSALTGFRQEGPVKQTDHCDFNSLKQRNAENPLIGEMIIEGRYAPTPDSLRCPVCGAPLHVNGDVECSLKHIPINRRSCRIAVKRTQMRCSRHGCRYTHVPRMPFKADGHMITRPLEHQIEDYLRLGLTLKRVAAITGVNKNIVKDIDKKRLERTYTYIDQDGRPHLNKPERQARFIAVDEFLLHTGFKFATIIIDLESGHIIYLHQGKKKKAIYDFIDNHVGLEWMKGVKAIACDMNSDYQEAFRDRCPHIKVVYDHFHIVKNFNDNVLSKVRNDERERLLKEGRKEEAKLLKGSKYILMSSREHLHEKERRIKAGIAPPARGVLFGDPVYTPKIGQIDYYKRIIKENRLLCLIDIIKAKIKQAYMFRQKYLMEKYIQDILRICDSTQNKHFLWFARLIRNHYEGIIAHCEFQISTGRIEGVNQMIKTSRREAYGYPDDEYFFLKIYDASRRRNKAITQI